MCALATARSIGAFLLIIETNSTNGENKIKPKRMDNKLNVRWKRPVLIAALLPLMVASNVSLHVPNSAPSITAIPPAKLIKPFLESMIAIPTVAEED